MPSPLPIRNIALIGISHGGKTSLAESILHLTGAITRRGKITDGTMTSDFEPEAIARQLSTSTSAMRTSYKGHTFNILDRPGFVDFSEEAKLTLLGVDTAVFVVEPEPHRLLQMGTLLPIPKKLVSRALFLSTNWISST